MLSLEKCKTVLKSEGLSLSQKEVEMIRKILYEIAEIEYDIKIKDHEKNSDICAGFNRGTEKTRI